MLARGVPRTGAMVRCVSEFPVAFWTRHGMVMNLTGQPEVVDTAIGELP